MSVRSNSFNSSNKSTKKTGKFCKVCFDSGKDESIYTSHFVKSAPSLGVIVCPTLKATECRYCKKSGHTVKFCKALQEKEKMNKKRKEMPTKTPVKKEKVVEKVRNPFEVLIMDSDDEDEDVIVSTIVTSMTSMTSMTSDQYDQCSKGSIGWLGSNCCFAKEGGTEECNLGCERETCRRSREQLFEKGLFEQSVEELGRLQ